MHKKPELLLLFILSKQFRHYNTVLYFIVLLSYDLSCSSVAHPLNQNAICAFCSQ